MKVLFIGDSLFRGCTGVNWLKKLAKKHPDWSVENAGAEGETMTKIIKRLHRKLEADNSYDVVVLEGGTNDILIPFLASKGPLFRSSHRYLLRKGYHPLENETDFGNELREAVKYIRSHTNAQVILTTIGCLNEDPAFVLNEKRMIFNKVIRDISVEMNCRLADVAALFDGYLQQHQRRDYFLENFFNTAWFDRFQSRYLGCPDQLSKERGLHLTIDGVHLNSRGAAIYLSEIEQQLLILNSKFSILNSKPVTQLTQTQNLEFKI